MCKSCSARSMSALHLHLTWWGCCLVQTSESEVTCLIQTISSLNHNYGIVPKMHYYSRISTNFSTLCSTCVGVSYIWFRWVMSLWQLGGNRQLHDITNQIKMTKEHVNTAQQHLNCNCRIVQANWFEEPRWPQWIPFSFSYDYWPLFLQTIIYYFTVLHPERGDGYVAAKRYFFVKKIHNLVRELDPQSLHYAYGNTEYS